MESILEASRSESEYCSLEKWQVGIKEVKGVAVWKKNQGLI